MCTPLSESLCLSLSTAMSKESSVPGWKLCRTFTVLVNEPSCLSLNLISYQHISTQIPTTLTTHYHGSWCHSGMWHQEDEYQCVCADIYFCCFGKDLDVIVNKGEA